MNNHAVDGSANDYDEFIATLRDRDLYGQYNVVFDTVGGRYAEAAFRGMAPEGRYVVFGFAAGGVDPASAFPQFPTNIMLMKGQRVIVRHNRTLSTTSINMIVS